MTKLLILLLICFTSEIAVASDGIVSLLRDRQYWEAFQWDKAENSTIWTLQGWENFTERDDRNKQTLINQRTVSILGIDLTASQYKKDLPIQLPWALGMYTVNKSAEQCEQITSWGTSKFGKPNLLDGSYEIIFGPNPTSQLDMAQKVYEWVIGPTRIVVTCIGLVPRVPKDSEPSFVTQMLFAHQTTEKPVTPLFGLKCTGIITASADTSIHWCPVK